MTASAFVVADQSAAFDLLGDPATHGGAPVTRIDTHGAAVFLAGDLAYKVKRAVRFPFMDFSTLEKRRAACEREVAINGAGAPGLYLGVSPITRSGGRLHLGGDGVAEEYAVRMRRFDLDATLDRVAARGGLSPALAEDVARMVVTAHRAAAPVSDKDTVAGLAEILSDNRLVFASDPSLFPAEDAERLAGAADAALARLAPLLLRRRDAGLVRRCHGDLHLRNIVLLDGAPVLFDAIEFNDDLATCDLLYDLAFLLMDLWERGFSEAANRVLNRYLWTWDADDAFSGLAALPLFLSVRAAIRAKVEAAGLAHLPAGKQNAARAQVLRYFTRAAAFLAPPPARLVAVGGLSGTGKSTLAAALAPRIGAAPGAVILRSDVERKHLAAVDELERLPASAYGPGSSAAVYARLRQRAGLALAAGHAVVLDAVHARPDERAEAEAAAREAHAPFLGLWLEAPVDELVARVDARRGDASDATGEVVRAQAGYDIGPITWHRIDVSGGRDAACATAGRWIDEQA